METEHWDEISKVEAEPVRIIDPGEGQKIVLRHFFFKSEPLPKGTPAPSKHEIVSHFKRLIETMLWSDGLIIREDKPIEVHTLRKARSVSKSLYRKMLEEKADFVILVLASARLGSYFDDKAHIAR